MTGAVAITDGGRELPASDPLRDHTARPASSKKVVPAGDVARLYQLGLTMTEIAPVYHVSEWVIAARLDQAGVRRRTSGDRAVLPVDRAVRRYRREPHLLAELAAGLGVSAQIIVDRSRRPGPRQRGQGRYRADVRATDVADLYRAGWTVKQIATKYGVAETTILNRLEQAAVSRRPKSLPAVFPADEAARRVRDEGASFAGLAREYGVSVEAVRYQMTARGVPAAVHAPRVLRGIPATDLGDLYAAGQTLAQIAGKYGVSRWTVSDRLRSIGVPRRPPAWMQRRQPTPLPLAEAAALYEDGESLAVLAGRYQVSASTVWSRLAEAGVTLRPPGGHNRIPLPVDELVALYAAGQTMARLAARYGVCETVIYNRLTEASAPIRHKTGNFKQVDPALLAALARQVGLEALL
jgi:lambda repressor-like predicted transcriptional regulator